MIKYLKGFYKIGNEELDNMIIIENPSIYIDTVTDKLIDKICNIHVIFRDVSKGVQYEEIILGFKYEITWEDLDIEEWLNNKLNDYKI